MKSKELTFDESKKGAGITAISLVEIPAILVNWFAFNDNNPQPVQFKSIDDDQQMIAGPVMIPNLDILRFERNADGSIAKNPDGTEKKYTVFYTAETVAKLNEDFVKAGRHASATLDHSMTLNGVTVIESWLIQDPEKDKAAHYGFSLPVGTWMVVMKVDDLKIWDAVKSGQIKGFSVEGWFEEEEKHTDHGSIKDKLNMIKTKIAELLQTTFASQQDENKPDQMGSVSVTDAEGTAVELIFAGDTLTVDSEVRILDEAGAEIPAPNGDYTQADGSVVTVVEGVVSAIEPAAEGGEGSEGDGEDPPAAEEMSAEKVKELIKESTDDLKESITKVLEKFSELVDHDTEKNKKLITELQTQMKTIPATDPIPDGPQDGEQSNSKRMSFKEAAEEFKKNK